MKNKQKQPALTFGEFVAAVYQIVGKRRARSLVQLAVNAHVVAFRGHRHFLIS